MTNQQHPITPSPEQVDQWFDDAIRLNSTPKYYIARQVALWSADQELEACCEWLKKNTNYHITIEFLRDARRPKPPSLKNQALQALEEAEHADHPVQLTILNTTAHVLIREALQSIPEPTL